MYAQVANRRVMTTADYDHPKDSKYGSLRCRKVYLEPSVAHLEMQISDRVRSAVGGRGDQMIS